MIGGAAWNLAGSFLLWRGCKMQQEWLNPYFDNVGEDVCLPGNISCSRNPKVGLGFALDDIKEG